MKGKKHSPEQIIKKLREADAMIATRRQLMLSLDRPGDTPSGSSLRLADRRAEASCLGKRGPLDAWIMLNAPAIAEELAP